MTIPAEERLRAALANRYAILREIGQGGMATVYLADDLKHERKVALKVLKPELAAVVGAERFLAEIKTTANLQHPHILPLYDSGEADSFLYYVMPYVDGETLREKLDRERQLPVDEAVLIASDMAEALDYAHRHGVIHRDIKPANVLMIEGRPVIADFGIALAVGSAGGARLTETGLSVGTPYYMSPEQATGDTVIGHQSDTYALGCVLYEMLIGEPPYVGATAQAVLGKIIQGAPISATTQRKAIPPHVDAVIRKSLEKLPADRFASAAGFAGALREPSFRYGPSGAAGAGSGKGWTRTTSAVAAVAVVALAGLAWAVARPGPAVPVERWSFPSLSEDQFPVTQVDVGPIGTGMVFMGRPESGAGFRWWHRRYDGLVATPVPGSENSQSVALSPDGLQLAAQTPAGDLVILPLAGGVPRTMASNLFCCPSWSADGRDIVVSLAGNVIVRVSVAEATLDTLLNTAGEPQTGYAALSPSGRTLVYTSFQAASTLTAVDLSSGERTPIARGAKADFLPGGRILFTSEAGELFVAPYREGPFALTSPPVPIADRLAIAGNGTTFYDVSPDGRIFAYWEGQAGSGVEFVWVDRSGAQELVQEGWTFDAGAGNRGWSISPDGRKIAFRKATEAGNDIWIKELGGPEQRLTFFDGEDRDPNWLPDSRTVTFNSLMPLPGDSTRAESYNLWKQVADGSRPAELVFQHAVSITEAELAPDGRSAVIRSAGLEGVDGGRDVFRVDFDVDPPAVTPILATPFDESAPKISPDGRWFAYQSNESGRDEVWIRPYPETTRARIQVSTDGGLAPRWSRDGRELFYLGRSVPPDMMAASLAVSGDELRVTGRTRLFSLMTAIQVGDRTTQYDVAEDGRFLMLRTVSGDEEGSRMVLIRNFDQLVRERTGGR